MNCRYCGFIQGNHSNNCPATADDEALANWQRGYDAGKAGSALVEYADDPHYNLGWVRGERAAEEAENSASWST